MVCRRRSISFRPVEPVSMGSGLVSTHGEGTWERAAAHKSSNSKHSRAITTGLNLVGLGRDIVGQIRSELPRLNTEYTVQFDMQTWLAHALTDLGELAANYRYDSCT